MNEALRRMFFDFRILTLTEKIFPKCKGSAGWILGGIYEKLLVETSSSNFFDQLGYEELPRRNHSVYNMINF